MFERIRNANPNRKIMHITDKEFLKYGRIVYTFDFSELMKTLVKMPVPEEGTSYKPADEDLEAHAELAEKISRAFFGEMPIEIGSCCGKNVLFNATEYHKGNEVVECDSDIVILVGDFKDIDADNRYDTAKMEAFFVPAGIAFEMYGGTLHYAPFQTSDGGFRFICILPRETNFDLEEEVEPTIENEILFMKNKWIICHPDAEKEISDGVKALVTGDNIEIKY